MYNGQYKSFEVEESVSISAIMTKVSDERCVSERADSERQRRRVKAGKGTLARQRDIRETLDLRSCVHLVGDPASISGTCELQYRAQKGDLFPHSVRTTASPDRTPVPFRSYPDRKGRS